MSIPQSEFLPDFGDIGVSGDSSKSCYSGDLGNFCNSGDFN